MSARFRIVTLCGSLGALPAYIEFLREIPADSGMAFVVLTHRRKDTPCWLVDILSRITPMLVEEIVNGTTFEPNRVYVMPAGQDLTIDGLRFCLVPATIARGWPNAFDIYLRSVAVTTYQRALTVILSGMAKDGSASLEGLRDSGGINYAQFGGVSPSMPKSAIETGMVDYIGTAMEIAKAILELPDIERLLCGDTQQVSAA
jgi:two-component system CheB/CheR fusion protein